MDAYCRERTVSAFASSSSTAQRANPGGLSPPPALPGQQHASNFRQRVKSDNARRPPVSSQLQNSYYLYSPHEAASAGGAYPARPKASTQASAQDSNNRDNRRHSKLQPQPSQETSHGFVSFNSLLDGVGLPQPPGTYQSRPLKSSLNASKARPHILSGAPSVPQSLLEPLSIEPGYSIHKPDTSQSRSYNTQNNNSKSMQTLASSLNRHNTLSSGGAHGHGGDLEGEASSTLSPEQCWYLLRTLVELEIEDECSKLWKLTGGLDAESVEWDSAMECSSDEPTTTEEMYREDPRVREVPVLRWLLRHLLEMPLVKEAGHDISAGGADRTSLVMGMNLFWHAGLSPLLRSLHEMDLSHPVDRGQTSFASNVSDAFTRGISRFVAAGLNFSDREGPQEPTGQSTTLVDEQLSKSQNSGYLSNISESPDYSRLFFSSPFSASGESAGPTHQAFDLFDSPITRHMAHQPKLSTLHSCGSHVQSQRVSYSGSNDTPDASPEKPRMTLAQRFRKEELKTLPSIPATPDADDEEPGEVLDSASDHTEMDGDQSKRHSTTSTTMFTAEEGFRTSTDEERHKDLSASQNSSSSSSNSSSSDSEALHQRPDLSQTIKQADVHDADQRPVTLPRSPVAYVAWPSAPMDPPSIEPHDLTPKQRSKRAQAPPPLDLAPPPNPRLSSSTPASSRQPSPSLAPSPSPQSTVKQQSEKPRKRYFTLSFSRKKPPKDLKANISSPVLVHEGSSPSPLDVSTQTPMTGQQRYFIDGEEARIAPMEYQDLPEPTSAVQSDQQAHLVPEGLIPRSGHEWQWHACQITGPTSGRAVSWGGFSVDIVGIRESLFGGRSFILRISRPSRLDEHVFRNMSDFESLRSKLLKGYPASYIRSLPGSKSSKKEAAKRDKEAEIDDFATNPAYRQRRQSMSRFSARLREAAKDTRPPPPELPVFETAQAKRSSRRGTLSTLRSVTPSEYSRPALAFLGGVEVTIPKHDVHRRALRTWLSDCLSVRGVPHDTSVTTFLLSNPQELSETDLKSMRDVQMVDEAHRTERRTQAMEAGEFCRLSHMLWQGLSHEIIEDDGLDAFSESLRTRSTLATCPLRFQKAADWLQTGLAQFLYDTLVATNSSSFSQFKAYVSAVPWFMLRTTLRLSNKRGLFRKALSDLFLARPYGSNGSLLERILAVFLQDQHSAEQLAACRGRIGSISICEKLRQFVMAERDVKQTVRRHAQLYDIPLVVAIARGGKVPALDQFDLERVVRASRHWERICKSTGAPPSGDALKNDPHIRLIVDMQLYLRLLSEARDGNQIRQALQSGILTEPILILLNPLLDLCVRLNHENNLADFVGQIQRFCDQLIAVVTSLRARVQEPQAGVRLLVKLLAKHRNAFYTFLHQAHLHDPIIDDLLAWGASVITYLKSSQTSLRQIYLAGILPSSEEALQAFATELDDLVKYHRQRRDLQQGQVFRQHAGDYTSDDPITVQGDGYGRSRTEPIQESAPPKPYIGQISQCLARFRSCIAGFFDVPDQSQS